MASENQNIMQQFSGAEAYEKRKEEDKNYKKGLLGYMGGIKGFIEDTTAGLTLGSALGGLAEAVPDALDPRTYTKQGQIEKTLEQGAIEAKDNLRMEQFLKDEGLLNDNPTKATYDAAKEDTIQNYDTSMSNIVNKINNSNPITTPAATKEEIEVSSNNAADNVIIPILDGTGNVIKQTALNVFKFAITNRIK